MVRPGLKLLYLSEGYSTHDWRFLSGFSEAGWRVLFLPLSWNALETRPLPVNVVPLTWPRESGRPKTAADFIQRARDLRTLLRKGPVDCALAGPIPSCAAIAALAGIRPLVSMSWGSDVLVEAAENPRARRAARFALRHSESAFGDCSAVREAIKSIWPLADQDILTFPWGIDRAAFTPGTSRLNLREERGWGWASRVFLSTRNLEPSYCPDILIRAFALLRQRFGEVRLLMLGSGSMEEELRQLLRDLNLEESAAMPGRVPYDQLPDYFRLADYYVSAAPSDGSSISLIEAMACAKPVVAVAAHGNLEWVEPGKNGELAKPRDAEDLASAMARLLESPGRLLDEPGLIGAGAANMLKAHKRANWEKNFPMLLDLLRGAAAKFSETHAGYRVPAE